MLWTLSTRQSTLRPPWETGAAFSLRGRCRRPAGRHVRYGQAVSPWQFGPSFALLLFSEEIEATGDAVHYEANTADPIR